MHKTGLLIMPAIRTFIFVIESQVAGTKKSFENTRDGGTGTARVGWGVTGTPNFWQISRSYSNQREQIMPTPVLLAPPSLLSTSAIPENNCHFLAACPLLLSLFLTYSILSVVNSLRWF